MTEISFHTKIMQKFVEALSTELSQDTFSAVLSKAGLPKEWAHPAHFSALDNIRTAQAYSRLQFSLRKYYGRGARGILIRIGTKLWNPLLEDAPLSIKTQATLLRVLPKLLRRKPALDLLAKLLGTHSGDITLHTLDLELLLVDHTSPTAQAQTDDEPICFVTLGLIQECLFWADGQVHDIEERTCLALGASQCEFKITIGA